MQHVTQQKHSAEIELNQWEDIKSKNNDKDSRHLIVMHLQLVVEEK